MRYGPNQKADAKKGMLRLAGARLKREGFGGIGIDALAAAAGVTSGAFYSNFSGKDDFLKEVLEEYMGETFVIGENTSLAEKKLKLREFLIKYLDSEHCLRPEAGCVMPTLSADVSRASKAVKSVYQRKMLQLVDKVAGVIGGAAPKKKAWGIVSLMIGAVTVGRSLPDNAARDQVLKSALELALTLVGDP